MHKFEKQVILIVVVIAVRKNEVLVPLSASQWQCKFNLYCVQYTVFEEQGAMVVVEVVM